MEMRLATVLNDTANELRRLSTVFDEGSKHHNEQLYGCLVSLEVPAIDEALADAQIEIAGLPDAATYFEAVLALSNRLEAIAQILETHGNYDSGQSIRLAIEEIRKAIEDA